MKLSSLLVFNSKLLVSLVNVIRLGLRPIGVLKIGILMFKKFYLELHLISIKVVF